VSVLDTADFAESTSQPANDQTVDVLEKSATEGTADFSIDDIDTSICATIQLDVSKLTVRKTPRSDLGIGPFTGATHLPNSDKTHSGDTNKYANFTSNANRDSVSKRTLSQDTSSLSVPADYQVIKKLGEGGMGVVYSAIQRNLDRTVAVKAIKSGNGVSEESRRKFFYEAQITGDLDHPNIVPIHDLGTNEDGTLFYSMKMVDGTPWLNVINDKSREENIEILMKVCDAVAFAHSRNIIHRDLKPENVMLGAFGEVLVMDWGLAIDLTVDQKIGMSGTPAFMAPEMASHQVEDIGRCSDIYILGAILFQIIVGKPPHGGKTVRECLMGAMENRIIETDTQDPMLDIAMHAMATEPRDRYETVIEFQEAIREHLRHAESIALTLRAEELLAESTLKKDYQGFSRALFSMKDAVDLWPANQAAIRGLKNVRLAYGQCAFERADYDLCLETLDPSEEDEKVLYESAIELKKLNLQREERFRMLRRVLIGVILFAGVSLTLATFYARRQAVIARQQEVLAKAATVAERAAKDNEAEAKLAAIHQKEIAEQAAEDEKAARGVAVAAEQKAKESEIEAVESAKIAARNARFATIGNYQSLLNLALSQTNQFDVSRSNQLLQDIKEIETKLASSPLVDSSHVKAGPLLQNWAFRRIQLLNNADLPVTKVNGIIVAMDFAPKHGLGVIGTSLGEVSVVRIQDDELALDPEFSLQFPDAVVAVAMADDGSEILVSTETKRSEYALHRWRLEEKTSAPVVSAGKKNLQKVGYSNDGKWIVGGINGGLWKWSLANDKELSNPFMIECRGKLLSLQFLESEGLPDQLFCTSILPNGLFSCFRVDLSEDRITPQQIPESVARNVTTAAIIPKNGSLLLGLNDGNLAIGTALGQDPVGSKTKKTSEVSINPVAYRDSGTEAEFKMLEPKRHLSSIRSLAVFSDGSVASVSDEPVIHLWQPGALALSISHRANLLGLPNNAVGAAFLGESNSLAAADDRGNLIVWDIQQQEQRQRVVRQPVPTPILRSASFSDSLAQSIDLNGVLQRWSKQDGSRIPVNGNSFGYSYFGHTPGVSLTDFSLAIRQPYVATIVKLEPLSREYTEAFEETNSELCLWSTATRQMMFRKRLETEGDCQITFADDDAYLVVGDSKNTFIVTVSDPNLPIVQKPFGTFFPVANPVWKSIVALFSPIGALRLIDLQKPSTWEQDGYQFLDLAINNRNAPIAATWSDDGERLYVVFEHGRIARFSWDGSQIGNQLWSEEIPALKSQERERPWRHMDIGLSTKADKSIKDSHTIDEVQIVLRQPKSNRESKRNTEILTFQWGDKVDQPSNIVSTKVTQSSWNGAKSPELIDNQWVPQIPSIANAIFDLKSDSQGNTVAADNNGNLFLRDKDSAKPIIAIGRTACRRATSNSTGSRWLTIHDGGIALICDTESNGDSRWTCLNHHLGNSIRGELSPDGNQIAFLAAVDSLEPICHVYTLNDLGELELDFVRERVTMVSWHPLHNTLVTMNTDGQFENLDEQGNAIVISSEALARHLQKDSQLAKITFFRESWSDDSERNWHLALQIDKDDSSKICFLSLSGKASEFAPIESKTRITSFAASNEENVLAIGDIQGNVSLWFASPSVDLAPRELFTLSGHLGASVDSLQFTSDGVGLFSSDTGRVNQYWKSRD